MLSLCQREGASCGACCGLYNRRDLSRGAVRAELSRRTDALAGLPRTPAAFSAAAAALGAGGPEPLFRSVRVCPLLGFLDAARTRVGCLAHPSSTGGPDLRDCGVYDVSICETFYCPSFSLLTEGEAALAAEASGDFHLYGLVVTDVPFLRAALGAIAERAGARVELHHLEHAPFRAAVKRLLATKEELAPGSDGLFGAFRPAADGGEAPRRLAGEVLPAERSPFDELLLCAGADPRSGNDLERLEAEAGRRLAACVRAFPG
jgi:hypothetical protein